MMEYDSFAGMDVADEKLSDLVERLFELKEEKRERNEVLKGINKEIASIEYKLAEQLQNLGLDKIANDAGSVTIKEDIRTSVKDKEAFVEWCNSGGHVEMIYSRANPAAVKAYMLETGEEPEGVEVTAYTKVNTRRA